MALIVVLTEVKPLLISFVYIVVGRETAMAGERVCWKGEEAAIVIVLFGSTEHRWCGKKRKTSCVLFMTE